MMAGPQNGVQAAMFVGHHARAGTSSAILDVRINTLLASSYGVPVVLASGDEAACAEFSALAPRAVTVPVK